MGAATSIVVFGAGLTASVGRYYLDREPGYRVVAFTVDGAYLEDATFEGLPVVAFEELGSRFGPEGHRMAVRIGATAINGLRAAKCAQASAAGYALVSYRHPSAHVAGNVRPGPNAFILEHAVIHPYAKVGSDVTVNAGAVVGHHASIGDHAFLASNASILGFATVEALAFVGANATVCEGTVVARATFVGANTLICKDTEPESVYVAPEPRRLARSSAVLSPWLVRTRASR